MYMRLNIKLVLTTASLGFFFVCQIKSKRISYPCLDALACAHTKKRECGIVKKTGEVRWFIDKCDIKEVNCEYRMKFVKTKKSHCKHIPPL